jgi:hypothetical protein
VGNASKISEEKNPAKGSQQEGQSKLSITVRVPAVQTYLRDIKTPVIVHSR